jgi:hypothetical protein
MIVSDEIALLCNHKDKEREREIRKAIRKKLSKNIKELNSQELTTKEQTDRLKDLQDQLRDLKKPLMNEPIFYSFDDITDDFDYGREVYKEDIYENHPNMDIPYKKQNLLYIPRGIFEDKFQKLNGYFKIGKESPCFIKYNVEIKVNPLNQPLSEIKKKENTKNDETKKINSEDATKMQDNANDIFEDYIKKESLCYNIFNHYYIKKLRNLYLNQNEKKILPNAKNEILVNFTNVKVRVYIYRCLNLTAQDSNISIIDKLAGYEAFCKANAYLELIIGKNYKSSAPADSTKGAKYICDSTNYVPNSLSPDFFKYYELEADLPEEWKLAINVLTRVEGALSDNLIGSNVIDLEDRFVGEFRTRNLIKFKSMISYYEQLLRDLQKKEGDENSSLNEEINKKLVYLNSKVDELKPLQVPVEFRSLNKPGTQVAQGILEMFVEVYPINIAKTIKPAKIEQPPPQDYELRLIIWQTRNIPLPGRKVFIII